ncbi:uncharacterized protein LOC115220716 [Octopus sinensis]|uniref:Uncharacterized protein LOC115220716 n=1 Tax=Octopus sinensis TaxID=2607531 RepID=A0A6P7TAI4_9MOLL|nr:uncharacterized protein LOC115220716 [Octopus sinensis]
MAIFIRGIIAKFNIREEFLALKSMHGTTRGEDLFQMVDSALNDFDLAYEKMSDLTTVGAAGREKGFLALIKNEFKKHLLDSKTLIVSLLYSCGKFMCKISRDGQCNESYRTRTTYGKLSRKLLKKAETSKMKLFLYFGASFVTLHSAH